MSFWAILRTYYSEMIVADVRTGKVTSEAPITMLFNAPVTPD